MRILGYSAVRAAAVLCLLLVTLVPPARGGDQPLDWQRARELYRREQRGETLTSDERAYLDRAKQERRRQAETKVAGKAKETTGLTPITEMGENRYKEQAGGLYGVGQLLEGGELLRRIGHAERDQHDLAGLGRHAVRIERPDEIRLCLCRLQMGLGRRVLPAAVQAAYQWAYPGEGNSKGPSPWLVMDERIQRAGVTATQVQAVWLKQAEISPARLGEFPAHAQTLRDNVAIILRKLESRFPNLRIVYLSSRIYAGYATTQLNPEPYAYESAFAMRWLIEAQINNDPNLNCDAAKGPVLVPLLLWGPYLWADGTHPRQGDGMVWLREDLGPDGTHPSTSGRQKVAQMLLAFFKTDPNAKRWFLREPVAGQR